MRIALFFLYLLLPSKEYIHFVYDIMREDNLDDNRGKRAKYIPIWRDHTFSVDAEYR